jgi:hypothetical protein
MADDKGFTRRSFVKGSAAALTASLVVKSSFGASGAGPSGEKGPSNGEQVPHRPLGKTGAQVSALGVGGYHLGSIKDEDESNESVARALDAGINFFDSAWEYHDGISEERLGAALKGKRLKAFVMTKVCTHGRTKEVALKQLEESLRRLQTDHLDLWQIHEVVYYNDPDLIFAPNGEAEALLAAKQQGKVRFIGFTGHKNPRDPLENAVARFSFRYGANASQRAGRHVQEFRAAGITGGTQAWNRRAGNEESGGQRRNCNAWSVDRSGWLALRDEFAGGHND